MLSKERVPVFVLKIYPNSNCDISAHIWDIYCKKKKNSAFISILSDLSEKKSEIQKFKIYLRITSANMTKKANKHPTNSSLFLNCPKNEKGYNN